MDNRAIPKEIALSNAEFSLKMEGFSIDNEYKQLCEKLLNKEISFTEYLESIKALQGLNE